MDYIRWVHDEYIFLISSLKGISYFKTIEPQNVGLQLTECQLNSLHIVGKNYLRVAVSFSG